MGEWACVCGFDADKHPCWELAFYFWPAVFPSLLCPCMDVCVYPPRRTFPSPLVHKNPCLQIEIDVTGSKVLLLYGQRYHVSSKYLLADGKQKCCFYRHPSCRRNARNLYVSHLPSHSDGNQRYLHSYNQRLINVFIHVFSEWVFTEMCRTT